MNTEAKNKLLNSLGLNYNSKIDFKKLQENIDYYNNKIFKQNFKYKIELSEDFYGSYLKNSEKFDLEPDCGPPKCEHIGRNIEVFSIGISTENEIVSYTCFVFYRDIIDLSMMCTLKSFRNKNLSTLTILPVLKFALETDFIKVIGAFTTNMGNAFFKTPRSELLLTKKLNFYSLKDPEDPLEIINTEFLNTEMQKEYQELYNRHKAEFDLFKQDSSNLRLISLKRWNVAFPVVKNSSYPLLERTIEKILN